MYSRHTCDRPAVSQIRLTRVATTTQAYFPSEDTLAAAVRSEKGSSWVYNMK